MKADLYFQFLADMPGHTLRIKRAFAAERALVWDCNTKSELLDRWFAPAPLTTKTQHMDFRPGGYWHYAMVTPDGTEYWGRTDFREIEPIERYTARDAFSDASGAPNTDMPIADWDVSFHDEGDQTLVRTIVTYASAEDLQKVIDMGMEAGMTATFDKLDTLLATLTDKG